MPHYRKRPIVVEAVQWVPGLPHPGVFFNPLGDPYVITIHGQSTAIGAEDWLIAEPDGVHYYPVKPDIFAATYEPVPTSTDLLTEGLSEPALAEIVAREAAATPCLWCGLPWPHCRCADLPLDIRQGRQTAMRKAGLLPPERSGELLR